LREATPYRKMHVINSWCGKATHEHDSQSNFKKTNPMKLALQIVFTFLVLIHFRYTASAKEILIEAENAELLNGASVVKSSLCSGGRKVGNMGDAARNGGIRFTFWIEKEGDYILDLYYIAGESRNFSMTVNTQSSVVFNCPTTGSWDTPGLIAKTIHLQAGTNTVLFDYNAGYAPDIDMVIVRPANEEQPTVDNQTFNLDKWKIEINKLNGKANIFFNNKPVLLQTQAAFKETSTMYFAEELQGFTLTETDITDVFGTGKKIQILAVTTDNKIRLKQNYYLYTNKDFIITDCSIESDNQISSNYLAPVYATNSDVEVLPAGNNKSIWVPFDNDAWVRYSANNFGVPIASYEVSALVNNDLRTGMVFGSIEHDLWKTGIRLNTKATTKLLRLEIYAGASSTETRDVIEHGAVKGNQIKSPKIFIGYFDDWRKGMETYADANETLAPKLSWTKGKPFCWNSWGVLQTKLSFTNASEVSQYFAENLQNNNYLNDSTVYIGLDSYWDNITYSNLVKFVKDAKARKQNAGIYWTPFVDWAKNPDRAVEGANGYYYRDIYLYANGQPQTIDGAYAVDPTHPATKARMDLYLNRFIAQGFTYLKLDFMCHGSVEADKHFNPEVQTGIQAYNEGMKYLVDFLDGKMYLNLSISPLFPAQYAHGRRIACDAYGSINNTEYTLNSLTYGWWLDRVYTYNDADNMVFSGFSTGENRARATSSVITGILCAGDDFSLTGSSTGKTRALTFLTNANVNSIARFTKAFYPVEMAYGNTAANMFMQTAGDTLYLAVFNYSTSSTNININFDRIGLTKGKTYTIHEQWSDNKTEQSDSWDLSVSRKDVQFLKIYEAKPSEVKKNETLSGINIYPNPVSDILNIQGLNNFSKLMIYDALGKEVTSYSLDSSENNISVNVQDLVNGIYLIKLITRSNEVFIYRLVK